MAGGTTTSSPAKPLIDVQRAAVQLPSNQRVPNRAAPLIQRARPTSFSTATQPVPRPVSRQTATIPVPLPVVRLGTNAPTATQPPAASLTTPPSFSVAQRKAAASAVSAGQSASTLVSNQGSQAGAPPAALPLSVDVVTERPLIRVRRQALPLPIADTAPPPLVQRSINLAGAINRSVQAYQPLAATQLTTVQPAANLTSTQHQSVPIATGKQVVAALPTRPARATTVARQSAVGTSASALPLGATCSTYHQQFHPKIQHNPQIPPTNISPTSSPSFFHILY